MCVCLCVCVDSPGCCLKIRWWRFTSGSVCCRRSGFAELTQQWGWWVNRKKTLSWGCLTENEPDCLGGMRKTSRRTALSIQRFWESKYFTCGHRICSSGLFWYVGERALWAHKGNLHLLLVLQQKSIPAMWNISQFYVCVYKMWELQQSVCVPEARKVQRVCVHVLVTGMYPTETRGLIWGQLLLFWLSF